MASSNLEVKRNEGAAISATRRPSLLLAATSFGKCPHLLVEELRQGTAEGGQHEVNIDIARDINNRETIAAGVDSVLHVVAAAGDDKSYRDSAEVMCRQARHLLVSPNSKGDTPLHSAARAGNTKMVQLLIELAAYDGGGTERDFLRMKNQGGETALHDAVRVGNKVMVQALIEKDPELTGVVASDGTSALYLACTLGHKEIAKELYEHDDKLSYSGPDGQTALHAAVLHGGDMTKLLLERNKDIRLLKQMDMHGSTPLHFAASAPDPSLQFSLFVFITRRLENYPLVGSYILPQECLTKLYEWMDHPLSQLLKFDEASVFQPDDVLGSFPVHIAASANSMESIVILLTKYPGCAGLCDAMGRTFLHVAVEKRRSNIVKFVSLRGHSFKSVLNMQDNDGNTALHLAILDGDLDMFKSLIKNHDVLINLQNRNGKTPMDLAQGKVQSGFYFGLTAQRRIVGTLSFANALSANRQRGWMTEYDLPLDKGEESKKITEFAQIVGIGSVLVATATFAAAFTMPGGYRPPTDDTSSSSVAPPPLPASAPPAGTPVLAGEYAFDGFVISNTLAFMCSTLATFSLVYCGVAAVDLQKRITLVSFALAFLLCAARSFCAAFAFALYLLLAGVVHGTAIASCVMTSLVLLDGLWFLWSSFNDTIVILSRRVEATLLKLVMGFLANIIYLFWPYLVIFGYLFLDRRINSPARPQQ